MAVPEAAVPPFGPLINGEYETARVVLQDGLNELYKSVNILAARATQTTDGDDEDGATAADIAALQAQIDAINTQITIIESTLVSLQVQINIINVTPPQTAWPIHTTVTVPAMSDDTAGKPYRVRDSGFPERAEMIVQDRNTSGVFFRHVIYQTFT